jgi:hypothetical protein
MAAPPTPPAPWIDGSALWQIVLLGLVAGAGLPALFAVGLRAMALPGRSGGAQASGDQVVGGSKVGLAVAVVCFAIVLAAIGWGIWAIYEAGH